MSDKIKIFLVDDDVIFLKLSEIEFIAHNNFEVQTYQTGESCIANLTYKPDVIVLDYYLNSVNQQAINGIETLDKIKKLNSEILVIMLSSQNRMELALDCMHHRAFDYVQKNKTTIAFLPQIIANNFNLKKMQHV